MARGTRKNAEKWLEHTKLTYPLLLDPDLVLYRHFGLRRSVSAVWTVPSLMSYAEDKIAGVASAPSYPGDDLHVMGGDFILDSTGKILYAYCSKFAADRPSVDDIFKLMVN